MSNEIRPQTGYLFQLQSFVAYLAARFRLFYVVLALTFVALIFEYAATSLMIPMAPGKGPSGAVQGVWAIVADSLGLQPVFRTWIWLFFVLMAARLMFGYALTVLTTKLGKQIHENLSRKIFGHILQKEPMGQVYTRSVGHYISLAGDDTFKSGTIVASGLQTVVGLMTAGVGILVLYQFSWGLFVGVMGFLSLSLVLVVFLMRRIIRLNASSSVLSREAGTTFIEALNSLRSIRSLHGERFVMHTYATQIQSYIKTLVEMDAIKLGVKAFPAIGLLCLAAVLMRPGAEVGMSDAALFAGTVIVIRIFVSLGQMVTAGAQLLTDLRAVKDIGMLVQLAQEDVVPDIASAPVAVHQLDLQGVTFSYGDRGTVLNDVNFQFKAGRTYAVVGPSGAGKSTLADILLGLSLPDSGSVMVNAGALSLAAARSRFMLVEQQPKIFSTTVKENLLLGAVAEDRELLEALGIVNLAEMVQSLERGVDTPLSYLGENFSGGQRQRLGIARALIRRPDVLILDEATSALDPVTRADVVSKLRARMQDGIIIFITHDPEIAALADEVLPIGATLPHVQSMGASSH